ncbi:MAG: hypothetical protein EOM03_09405 [Clostridia bacterium]|nr:hypothetical protein [Clostridia bacterium]
MTRKKLPIGIQTFRKIREDNYYYVDKTSFACRLAEEGSHYFLSRPRRFGKSLFLDTLKELFEGNRDLFTGLEADARWDWSVRFPVLRFSFAGGVTMSLDLMHERLAQQISEYEERWGIASSQTNHADRFRILIHKLHAATGQRVVILVDEYDKPILDRIEDREQALAIREVLKDFYSVIKDNDAHVRFAFLTGVSKFSKAGIFSGLNNLNDITVDPVYSAICGYTETDLDAVFAPELPGLDREEIRSWYNGYNWLGEAVYNPFDVLLLFSKRQFAPYWFETGTPTFLVKLLMERKYVVPNLERLHASAQLLSTFDVDTMPVEALLWQSGYLTFAGQRRVGVRTEYALTYPNLEVQSALNDALHKALVGNASHAESCQNRLFDLLVARDFPALETHTASLFAAIPHDWHRKNELARYEGYYASVFYSHFAALGLDIRLEDATSLGRIDMTVLFDGAVFIFEFKVVEDSPEGRALAQIKARNYAEKYRALAQPIHLIGIEFSRQTRTVTGFEVENM